MGLQNSAWPKFRRDEKNTGQSPYLSTSDGTLKWETENYSYEGPASPAIAIDGTIYIADMNDYGLTALNPDGTLKWFFEYDATGYSCPTIGDDDTIYFASEPYIYGGIPSYLYAVNPDGTLKWQYSISPNYVRTSPAIGSDGTIFVGGDDGILYAINPEGTLKWSFPTGAQIQSSPAIGNDGTIYFGSYDNNLYAVNPDGTLKWNIMTGFSSYYYRVSSSPAIGSDGTIFVGSYDGSLYAVNPNGTLKWSYTTGAQIRSSPAIGSDGTIFVGSYDGNLYAVKPDGTLKWSYTTGDRIGSSPAIDSGGNIYYVAGDYLTALNPDGTLKWNARGAQMSDEVSPVIGADGVIYLSIGDSYFHAYGFVTPACIIKRDEGIYSKSRYCYVGEGIFKKR